MIVLHMMAKKKMQRGTTCYINLLKTVHTVAPMILTQENFFHRIDLHLHKNLSFRRTKKDRLRTPEAVS